MSLDSVRQVSILKARRGEVRETLDWVVVEEPLEIRVQGEQLAVLMRTPGHDMELAAGFCLTEGVVGRFADIGAIRHCREDRDPPDREGPNAVDVTLAPGIAFDRDALRRNLIASAACGLCGRASIEALSRRTPPSSSRAVVRQEVLVSLPARLAEAQGMFERTGALHAAALFDVDGRLVLAREDVGRHNAVDKVVGRAAIEGWPLTDAILMVSGRTSFEILQKAAAASIPIVCAVSGPTTLAIETARAFRLTLVNFLRDGGFNIATCPERILLSA
ncbi:MAG TPA: formate dehydrogenase accessory sulfurtransferase FdhD [Patescibacteria group bacterium]|nr:formate dehydrogenase accessory sulfurtransferase FdhD [Patescibacteria group bacterium]